MWKTNKSEIAETIIRTGRVKINIFVLFCKYQGIKEDKNEEEE